MSNEARVDSTEADSPPQKKPKTDPEAVAEAEVQPEIRILRKGDWDDPEFKRQRDIFEEQFEKSEGYDIDWDNLDFDFPAVKFEWAGALSVRHSSKELMNWLIETAIEEENEDNATNLELVEYVSANVEGVQGFLFYITFWAKDASSPSSEPKLYQTKVRKFMGELFVSEFRLRPTQEL